MQISYCLVGFTLLFSSIWMSLMNRNKGNFIRFYNLLDSGQKEKYEKIVMERMMIYLAGMFLGALFGYYYYHINKGKDVFCKVLAISYCIKIGFYYFFPKSPLMLYSLTSTEQTDAWADIYSEMKNRWIKSLVLGLLSYLFLLMALLK